MAHNSHSKVVSQWIEENADKIAVFYLPSYSPDLNPGELLNACLKQRVTTAVLARTKMQLVKSTSRALRSIQKQHARGKRCFQHPAVKNAA
jgi:transposase